MTDNPFAESSRRRNVPQWRKDTARHNVQQYTDLLETVDAMRIKAGITFDELAERLGKDADILRQELSLSYDTLTFNTLSLIGQACGVQYTISVEQTPEVIASPEEQQHAAQDKPEPVLVAHSIADLENTIVPLSENDHDGDNCGLCDTYGGETSEDLNLENEAMFELASHMRDRNQQVRLTTILDSKHGGF